MAMAKGYRPGSGAPMVLHGVPMGGAALQRCSPVCGEGSEVGQVGGKKGHQGGTVGGGRAMDGSSQTGKVPSSCQAAKAEELESVAKAPKI